MGRYVKLYITTPMHSTQLCVVELIRTTPAPMVQDIKARLVLCIVSAYAETSCVSPARGFTARGIGCRPRARVPSVADSGVGRASTTVLDPRNYAKNIAAQPRQEPRSAWVKRMLPIRTIHS